MSKIDEFDYVDARSETTDKADDIVNENNIKQIDSVNFVVTGINSYKLNIDEENRTLVCECKGYENHEYCKHSIALHKWLEYGENYKTMSKRVTDKDIMQKKVIVVAPTKEQQDKMDMLVQAQETKQVILKKTIPVLEIN